MKRFNKEQFCNKILLEITKRVKEDIIYLSHDINISIKKEKNKNIIDIRFLTAMENFDYSYIKYYKNHIIDICNELIDKEKDYNINDINFRVHVIKESDCEKKYLLSDIDILDRFNNNIITVYKEIEFQKINNKSFIEWINMFNLDLLYNIEMKLMRYLIREGRNNNPKFLDDGVVIIELDTITYNLFGYVDELSKRKIKDIIERLTLLQIIISTKNGSFLSKMPIYSLEFIPKAENECEEDTFVIVIGMDERTKYDLYNN